MLLRTLRLPLPLAPKCCPCGGRLDEYGDHRSAYAQVGVLARRAGLLERAATHICKEAGHQPGLARDQAVDRKHRAYPELRQARRCRHLPPGCLRRGSWWASQPRHPDVLATDRAGKGSQRRATRPERALESPGRVRSARAHACSLLELPIAGPSAPSDDQEVPLSELLAGSLRTGPSWLA